MSQVLVIANRALRFREDGKSEGANVSVAASPIAQHVPAWVPETQHFAACAKSGWIRVVATPDFPAKAAAPEPVLHPYEAEGRMSGSPMHLVAARIADEQKPAVAGLSVPDQLRALSTGLHPVSQLLSTLRTKTSAKNKEAVKAIDRLAGGISTHGTNLIRIAAGVPAPKV